jgi:hypothetical protein
VNYERFLSQVIEEGMEAAKKDYTRPEQQASLHGALAGFEVCRGKAPSELYVLMIEAMKTSWSSRAEEADDPDTHWFKRCYTLEIEWVCNVVSAMMLNEGLEPIVVPSARGVLKADNILRRG